MRGLPLLPALIASLCSTDAAASFADVTGVPQHKLRPTISSLPPLPVARRRSLMPHPSLRLREASSDDRNEENFNNGDDEGGAKPFSQKIDDMRSSFQTAASEGFGTRAKNVAKTMQEGDVVVPICGNLELRQTLAERGVYAGVEYVICELARSDDEGIATTPTTTTALIRPAYPLRDYLERSDWPVSVDPAEVPLWLSKATYEAGTALGTLALAGTYLAVAATAALFLRIVVVPSESMMPTLNPGDVVLATRSILPPRPGDVAFFNPPEELERTIAEAKIEGAEPTKGKQFLKRVVAVPGESVGVRNSNPIVVSTTQVGEKTEYKRVDLVGKYSRPEIFSERSWNRDPMPLAKGEYFVAGDNGYRSVDSRVWGPLKGKYVFGTAKWVVFPLEHFGPIHAGNLVDGAVLNNAGGGNDSTVVTPSIIQPTVE